MKDGFTRQKAEIFLFRLVIGVEGGRGRRKTAQSMLAINNQAIPWCEITLLLIEYHAFFLAAFVVMLVKV